MKTRMRLWTVAGATVSLAFLAAGCSSTRTVSTGCGPAAAYYGGPASATGEGTVIAGGTSAQAGGYGYSYYQDASGQTYSQDASGQTYYQGTGVGGAYTGGTLVQYDPSQYTAQYGGTTGSVQYQMPTVSVPAYTAPSASVQYQMPATSGQGGYTYSGGTGQQYQGYVAVPQYSPGTGTVQSTGTVGNTVNQMYSGYTQYAQPPGAARRRGFPSRLYRVVNDR